MTNTITEPEETSVTKELRADPDTTWVRAKSVVQVVVITAAAVILYMRFEQRMTRIEDTMSRDVEARRAERSELIASVNGVRDQLRQVFADGVVARQAQGWIELARVLNREKYPTLIWPDLPR